MTDAQESEGMSTKRERVAQLARERPEMAFTSLAHLIDLAALMDAFHRTRRDGAAGVDGQTWADYEADLETNLRSLLDRAKSGRYVAPPVRRVWIPKAGSPGEARPLGIPTPEDKVLQRAVAEVLALIYEQDFLDCSYGFRPGRSAHQALAELWEQAMDSRGGWVLDVDVKKFFDTIDHRHLREFLGRRVRDGVLLRLIDKWLKAGVLDRGTLTYPEAGTPQGGVVSPLLANIYLHYVLDRWYADEVRPRLRGESYLIRYADDFVIGFAHESDARRVEGVLPKRFAKYGLTIHAEKTRLVRFAPPKPGRPSETTDPAEGEGHGGSFDFLGFTHFWGGTRRGGFAVFRKTSAKRLVRGLRAISGWLREHRHDGLDAQHLGLSRKLTGHCAYYGITGNSRSLGRFRTAVARLWKHWLGRRRRSGRLSWEDFKRILGGRTLPAAVCVHSVYRVP